MEILGLILVVLSFLGVAYFWVVSLITMAFISKQGCMIPFRYSAAPGGAVKHYIRWCNDNGVKINNRRINTYNYSVKTLLAAFLSLVLGLTIIIIGK